MATAALSNNKVLSQTNWT